MYSKGLGDMDFGNLDFKYGRGVPSEKYGYKLGSSRDGSVDYFACWPYIEDVIKLLSTKAKAIEIINACALDPNFKLLNSSSSALNVPNGSDVPGFYGKDYSLDSGLALAAQDIARMNASFLLKLATVLSTLGGAGLIVACTVLSGPAMVVLAALGGSSTLVGMGFFAKSQFPSAPAPVVAQHAI